MDKIRIFVKFCIMLLISSCATLMYYPSRPNVPLYRHAKEGKVSGSLSLNSLDLQGSYAFNNFFLLQAE